MKCSSLISSQHIFLQDSSYFSSVKARKRRKRYIRRAFQLSSTVTTKDYRGFHAPDTSNDLICWLILHANGINNNLTFLPFFLQGKKGTTVSILIDKIGFKEETHFVDPRITLSVVCMST
jgi:hypothetical protein